MRIEAVLAGDAASRQLIGLPDGCDLDQLRALVQRRLGLDVVPERLCVGEAQVMDVADLRDGDVVTVVPPDAAGSGPGPCSLLQPEPARPRWYTLVHTALTLVIFVLLNELFQKFVFNPWFHPDLDDEEPGGRPGANPNAMGARPRYTT